MNSNRGLYGLVIISNILLIAVLALLMGGENKTGNAGDDRDRAAELVAALEARGLYQEALKELERERYFGNLDRTGEAELLLKMGKIAHEEMDDCEAAAAYFTMASSLLPGTTLSRDADKRAVVCLEKTGNDKQARALLRQLTGETGPDLRLEGPVVATVDNVEITWTEIVQSMKLLTDRQPIQNRAQAESVLQDYLFTRLLAEEAVISGLDQSPEMHFPLIQADREVLATEYLKRKIEGKDQEQGVKDLTRELLEKHQVRIFNDAIPVK